MKRALVASKAKVEGMVQEKFSGAPPQTPSCFAPPIKNPGGATESDQMRYSLISNFKRLQINIEINKQRNEMKSNSRESSSSINARFLKKVPPFDWHRNETVKYYYSSRKHLNLSTCSQDSHTLRLKIIDQTPEIQAPKVKIYSAPKTSGFEKGPSHDLHHVYFSKHLF